MTPDDIWKYGLSFLAGGFATACLGGIGYVLRRRIERRSEHDTHDISLKKLEAAQKAIEIRESAMKQGLEFKMPENLDGVLSDPNRDEQWLPFLALWQGLAFELFQTALTLVLRPD